MSADEKEAAAGTDEHREDGNGIGRDTQPGKEPDEIKTHRTDDVQIQPVVGL